MVADGRLMDPDRLVGLAMGDHAMMAQGFLLGPMRKGWIIANFRPADPAHGQGSRMATGDPIRRADWTMLVHFPSLPGPPVAASHALYFSPECL